MATTEPLSEPSAATGPVAPMWPYVLPMVVFVVLTWLEGWLPQEGGRPHASWYPAAYAVKAAIVLGALAVSRRAWADLRPLPDWGGLLLSVGLGVVVAVAWVGLEWLPYPKLVVSGGRAAFDPNVLPPFGRAGFLAVRFFGLVVLVPVLEELFWRSFLIRWLIDTDFGRVPLGTVTPRAAGITAGLFALAHPEWLPALLTGLAWAWLVWRTRSVMACVVSHAVANLGLGLYILKTGAWQLW